MYFVAGSIRTNAHDYLYDSSSLPHRRGKLAKRSLPHSDYERVDAEASRGWMRSHMQGFHF